MEMLLLLSSMKKTVILVSMAVILKLSQPVIVDIPNNLTLIISCLKPPYLYLLINCIILSIVASSKIRPRGTSNLPSDDVELMSEERAFPFVPPVVAAEDAVEVQEEVKEVVFGYAAREQQKEKEKETETETKTAPPKENVSYSTRFERRKAVKASSPEGKTVLKKVSRPKRQETLESTWRTITEGRSMPLTRHLRKSDTFAGASQEASSPVHVMKKSDTFSYGGVAESPSPGSSGDGKLKREPSLSQDDLNRRVEAFIKKFNEEMRLQRQESFKQYREIGRQGVY